MKLQCLQENLARTLTIVSRFTYPKVQLPVLANILLSAKKNTLLVSATNLETSICVSVGAKVDKEGEITVPARVVTEIISNLAMGQISLKAEKEQLSISAPNFESTLSGMNSSDFPLVPQEVSKDILAIPKDVFLDSLSCVLFSSSVDDTRPVLTGILLIIKKGEIVLVSTDGFRLSQKKIKVKTDKEITMILPSTVLGELVRLPIEDEQIAFSFKKGENQVVFGFSGTVLTSRIIEGEFPDFEKILPKSSNVKVTLDKEELLRAVKLASVFARDAANVVKLTVKKDLLNISAESSRSGKQDARVEAKVEGEGIIIAFNYRFLEEFLNAVKGEEVRLEFSNPNAPGVFLDPKDPDFLHIIMPVRIQG